MEYFRDAMEGFKSALVHLTTIEILTSSVNKIGNIIAALNKNVIHLPVGNGHILLLSM